MLSHLRTAKTAIAAPLVLISLGLTSLSQAEQTSIDGHADNKNKEAKEWVFDVRYSLPEEKPVHTPRVYVVLSKAAGAPVNHMTNWTRLPVLFAADDSDGDGIVTINSDSLSTQKLSQLKGKYKAQAVIRLQADWPVPGKGAGDLLSDVKLIDFSEGSGAPVNFHAQQVVPAPTFRARGKIQDHYFASDSLSAFHKRPYQMRYSVILPDNWQADKKYPVLVFISGFTGVHHQISHRTQSMFPDLDAIIVIPDANCRGGHSVFADSATNGPWGQALTEELLPHIDKKYGGMGARHRYVTGASSGGWASLWLTVTYPEVFRCCWAVAPDPVDFHAFQAINLRDGKADNLFSNDDGSERLLSLKAIGLSYRNFANYERVLGPGGQINAFSSVFSPRLANGQAAPWYNTQTGEIDSQVCESWAPYDISRQMKARWKEIQPKVAGKLNISVHRHDYFLLNFAVSRLEKVCQKLGSDARFTYYQGPGHHIPQSTLKEITAAIQQNKTVDTPAAPRQKQPSEG